MDNQASVNNKPPRVISGTFSGNRVESRVLEEQIQEAVEQGERSLEVSAFGQHGIGGRLWRSGNESVYVKITGQTGQRVGSMGFPNTFIEVLGPASDDVGWLNAGAELTILGDGGDTTAHCAASGKIFVAGRVGTRSGSLMKHDPAYDVPEFWVLKNTGSFSRHHQWLICPT